MKISVIIPCYNVEKYIDRCLASVTGQSIGLDELEIICVDDCSTDNTYECLQAWEKKFPENILVVHLDHNRMLGAARNIGLSYASGEYVTFVDSDDWLDTRFIEMLYSVSESTGAEMVRCGYIRDNTAPENTDIRSIVEAGEIQYRNYIIDSDDSRRSLIRMMSRDLMAWGKLIKREFLFKNNIYFPEGLAYEDNLWGPLLDMYTSHFCVVEADLYHYYINDSSLSLKLDATHHPDFLTVQLIKWNELSARGFFELYRDEIEYDFIHSCFLDFMKIIVLRYSVPQFSLFNLMKTIVNTHIEDVRSNPYYEQGFTEFQKILLKFLYSEVTKDEFLQMAEYVKQLGI